MKPSFFQNEDLAACGPFGMLLFEGLWCHADREGRLDDRPVRIKVQVLPYFECDVDSLLNCLEKHGFILRYTIENSKYIQVLNFTKHQNPHIKEQASSIPAPDKSGAGTGKTGTSPADSLLPLTDSLSVSSLREDTGRQSLPVCPHQRILDLYHEKIPEKRRHTSWDGIRQENLAARWRWLLANKNKKTGKLYFNTAEEGVEWFGHFFIHCRKSKFLMEKCRVFCLEWAVKKANFHKIIEGAYHND